MTTQASISKFVTCFRIGIKYHMKIKIKSFRIVSIVCVLFGFLFSSDCQAASLAIASNGKTAFSIVVPKVAALPVNNAATEMQRDIAEATGAKLPIVKDDQVISGPFISLGRTKQAASAGISDLNIPVEGFRIVTKDGNLYIIGLDTTAVDINRKIGKPARETFNMEMHPEIPGPAFTKNGGVSQGTANGVYTFLQEHLGVRWLMPGELGRDVPGREIFKIEEMDRTQAPEFIERVIYYLGGGDAQAKWRDHQRLGASFRVNTNHSWSTLVPASLYKEHPDWFPMDSSGARPKPTGDRYKLETTNPQLVKYVAEKAIEALKKDPQLNTFSLSPTDSGGWSQSPQSKPFYDPPGPGRYGQSTTRLVLKFYDDVSAIVAKEYPQGKLTGYIYGDYTYPPAKSEVKFPDNFVPMLVHQGGGYTLYRPQTQEAATAHIEDWSKFLPERWFFYTHPLWLRASEAIATVTPAAPETLNAMFSTYVKYGASGGIVYGTPQWGYTALKNYILAQMLWNPRADANAIQHDWLMRAYGPHAGPVMEEFYNQMDASWFSEHFRLGGSYAGDAFAREVYGTHYPQMEALFLKAWNQPMTARQKERLELIRNQMIVLQWKLRNKKYLPADYVSPLKADAKQAFAILTSQHKDFQPFGGIEHYKGAPVEEVKVQLASPKASEAGDKDSGSQSGPNSSSILFFPTRDGEVTLHPTEVDQDRSILMYSLKDEKGYACDQGILFKGDDITFKAKANVPYYLSLQRYGPGSSSVEWQISVPHSAVIAQATLSDGAVNLHPESTDSASLYVYVPEELSLATKSEGSGVVIHTPTSAQRNTTKDYMARRAAHAARDSALKRHNAEVWVDLNYSWRFQTDSENIGEKQGFEKPDFQADKWKGIRAVGSWQDLGFKGYYGTAWYRKTFNPFKPGDDPLVLAGRQVLLYFGAVDGDAVFYLNGKKIGEHKMLDSSTSWRTPIVFDVTDIIHANSNNSLAVKVTKDRLASGIYKGAALLVGTLDQ